MTDQQSRTAIAVVLLVIILGAGIGIGIVIGRRSVSAAEVSEAGHRGPQGRLGSRMLKRFRHRLGLDNEQTEKVAAILEQARAEASPIHDRVAPELRAIRKRTREAIRALLTPEQASAYEALMAEKDARKQHRKGRRSHRGRSDFEHSWSVIDTNSDKNISRAECEASEHPLAQMCVRRFEQFDTDKSGVIESTEMSAAREAMHRRMREGWEKAD